MSMNIKNQGFRYKEFFKISYEVEEIRLTAAIKTFRLPGERPTVHIGF